MPTIGASEFVVPFPFRCIFFAVIATSRTISNAPLVVFVSNIGFEDV